MQAHNSRFRVDKVIRHSSSAGALWETVAPAPVVQRYQPLRAVGTPRMACSAGACSQAKTGSSAASGLERPHDWSISWARHHT